LKTSTTRGEILKAIYECETMYFVESIQAMKNMGMDTAQFIAAGGGAQSDFWLQIKADVFGIPFVRPKLSEAGVCGAAMLAGISTGVFASPKAAADLFVKPDKTFTPNPKRHMVYREKFELYKQVFPANHNILKQI
jgi:xylulokinase